MRFFTLIQEKAIIAIIFIESHIKRIKLSNLRNRILITEDFKKIIF